MHKLLVIIVLLLNICISNPSFSQDTNTTQIEVEPLESKNFLESSTFKILEIGALLVIVLVLFIFMWQRSQKNEAKKRARADVLNDQTLSLLSGKATSAHLNFEEFLEEFLYISKLLLEIETATYWIIEGDKLKSKISIHRDRFVYDSGQTIPLDLLPKFSNDLLKYFSYDDIIDSELYRDEIKQQIDKTNTKSLMSVPLFLRDELKGLVTYSTIKTKKMWNEDDKKLAITLSNILVSAITVDEKEKLTIEKELLINSLKSKNQKLMEFNSVLSHNVREPLTQILGFSSVLSEIMVASENESVKKIVTKIKEASEKSDLVIKELTEIIIQKDIDKKDLHLVNINHLLEKVLDNLDELVSDKTPLIARKFNVKSFYSYEPYLEEILHHLVSNSLKYASEDRPLEIDISTEENEENYILCISDNGIGIDMSKYKNKIFKIYERIHLDVKGRGLGLYIVDNRVTALQGTITFNSELSKGTTVLIHFKKQSSTPPHLKENG